MRRVERKRPDVERAIAYARERMAAELSPALDYHGLAHTFEDVLPAARQLAAHCELGEEETDLLTVAAAFHDIGWVVQGHDHERIGADIAREVLPAYGFSQRQVAQIADMILATHLDREPSNLLEEILIDADLDVLGRDDFFPVTERLRAEIEANDGGLSDAEWYGRQVQFLERHHYRTDAARRLRRRGKERNLAEMRRRLEQAAARA